MNYFTDSDLRMKKLLSISLVLVFFYSFIGFYLNFAIEQCVIKEQVKEKIISNLPENELTIIKISLRDQGKITWMEEGKEFSLEGILYDVVKIKKEKDSIYYYCFCDVKESKLIANLDKLVKDQTDHSKSRTSLNKQQINVFFHEILLSRELTESPVHYFNFTSGYNFVYSDVLSPPPRILATS